MEDSRREIAGRVDRVDDQVRSGVSWWLEPLVRVRQKTVASHWEWHQEVGKASPVWLEHSRSLLRGLRRGTKGGGGPQVLSGRGLCDESHESTRSLSGRLEHGEPCETSREAPRKARSQFSTRSCLRRRHTTSRCSPGSRRMRGGSVVFRADVSDEWLCSLLGLTHCFPGSPQVFT